ncbi:unnamed protein product [Bursaphelenchus okinawaensis]|uniref:Uncharacterized protein n=1 Tax=Bursaphelenchus okinawaensis TaxID=465554 RepID=A0A811L847_9BILA|nr:unnamed protein product [Bursaphelenchus okinawaensis]CAG9117518.1 unnamed protein product [Bursaphelenchus okinawaensis]
MKQMTSSMRSSKSFSRLLRRSSANTSPGSSEPSSPISFAAGFSHLSSVTSSPNLLALPKDTKNGTMVKSISSQSLLGGKLENLVRRRNSSVSANSQPGSPGEGSESLSRSGSLRSVNTQRISCLPTSTRRPSAPNTSLPGTPISSNPPKLTVTKLSGKNFWSKIYKSFKTLLCNLFGNTVCQWFKSQKKQQAYAIAKSYAIAYETEVILAPTTKRLSDGDKPANVPHWMTVANEKNSMLKMTLLRTAQGAKAKTKKIVHASRRMSLF